jgi:polar amino acid transport system substrate-binding protein
LRDEIHLRREIGIIVIIGCIGIGFASGWIIPAYILDDGQIQECPECPECPGCPEEPEPLIDQIKLRGEIIVGTSADFPPFEFYNVSDGSIVGFDIDLSQMIADELDVNLTIVDMSFDSLIAACNVSTIDMIAAAMMYTESRAEVLAPSLTYLTLNRVVVVRNDSILTIESLDNLTSYTVGVQAGSIMQQDLEDLGMIVGVNLITYPSAETLFIDLDTGGIDAAYVGEPIYTSYNEIYNLKIIYSIPGESLVLWCKYGEPELLYLINKVIFEAYQTGKIYDLTEKWLS